MSYLVANLPPIQCFIKKEYLYDFEKRVVKDAVMLIQVHLFDTQ